MVETDPFLGVLRFEKCPGAPTPEPGCRRKPTAMNDYTTSGQESDGTDIEPRTRRALERVYSVLHIDCTPIGDDETPTVVSVVSGNSGREHRVDVREEKCTCEDYEYRGVECAHIRRAKVALGHVPVHCDTLAAVNVHEQFAANAPGPAVVTSDGGIIDAGDDGEVNTILLKDWVKSLRASLGLRNCYSIQYDLVVFECIPYHSLYIYSSYIVEYGKSVRNRR